MKDFFFNLQVEVLIPEFCHEKKKKDNRRKNC